jgi:hypothetical protein
MGLSDQPQQEHLAQPPIPYPLERQINACCCCCCCAHCSAAQPAAAGVADSISLNDQLQLLDTRGWQMTTESTAPFLSITRDDLIQWGVMLGAGEVQVGFEGLGQVH